MNRPINIPDTASAAWAIPGIKERIKVKMTDSDVVADAYVKRVCEEFKINVSDFKSRYAGSGRPRKKIGNVYVGEIRKVMAFDLRQRTTMKLRAIGSVVGYADHTSTRTAIKNCEGFVDIEDSRFYAYYRRIKFIPLHK